MAEGRKHFLARRVTRVYLESYLIVLTFIFFFPVVFMLLVEKSVNLLGANIIFFEFNLFLSLVLMIYTYLTRYENRNWKLFFLYFILSFVYLVSSMILLGGWSLLGF